MQNSRNKLIATIIATILVTSMAMAYIDLPATDAHTPAWQFTTYAYISAAPNPVGVGQSVLIFVGIDYTIQGNSIDNNIRFRNYKLDITKPDGTNDTKVWDIVVDSTASAYFSYAPTVAGNYTLNFYFPGQVYDYGTQYPAYAAYNNDTYTASHASMTLVVQTDLVPKLPENPLPTEYWARNINGQNHAWDQIASNWLGGTTTTGTQTPDIWQKNGDAPRSAHVMWTKPIEFGGMVGGGISQIGNDNDTAQTFYSGFSYNTRFGNPMIVNGILYYTTPNGESGSGGGNYGVDLRTGSQVWQSDTISPSKAQMIDFQTPNQHGVIASIMWVVSGTTWIGYNQFNMKPVMNITNVPSGTEVYTNDGNILRYILSYSTTTKNGTLALWNETAAISNQNLLYNGPGWPGGVAVVNGSLPNAYTWTMPIGDLSGSTSPAIVGVIPGDIMLGRSSNVGLSSTPNPNSNPWTMWAINLNASKGTVGQILWKNDYAAPAGNITRMLDWQPIDPVTRAWVMTDFETSQRSAYNLDDGNLRWGPVGTFPGFQYFSAREGLPAYGNLYVTGYGGIVYCYSMTDGTLLWTYGNGGAGNSTNSYDETPWGRYPTHAAAFADNMIFTMSGEHSPNTPLYKGYKARALDAFTGQEMWTLQDWSASGLGTSVAPVAIADGYLAFANAYDGQVYVVGKGPSSITVEAPSAAITQGQSLVIRGTVTDISAGTQQEEQAARFPHGVPAVSDESQGAWMEYIYEQQPRPTDTTGVPVTLSVVDANGNYRTIGNTTSTADGFFTYNWQPDIAGQYTVYASFAGSNSYYPSNAVTSFAVDPVPPTAAPPTQAPQAPIETYLTEATAAIIAAIVLVGVAIIVIGRKRP